MESRSVESGWQDGRSRPGATLMRGAARLKLVYKVRHGGRGAIARRGAARCGEQLGDEWRFSAKSRRACGRFHLMGNRAGDTDGHESVTAQRVDVS